MKKIIICVVMMLLGMGCYAQQSYSKSSNGDFVATKTVRKSAENSYKPTGKYYVDRDSVRYEIYLHTVSKGDKAGQTFCYIQKVSKKTRKTYWKRIYVKPEEVK